MFKFKENSKFSLYGLIQTISIVGLFLAVGLIVLAATGTLHMGTGLIQFVGIIAVICLCGLMSLVWARNLERGKQKNSFYSIFKYYRCSLFVMDYSNMCCYGTY